MPNTSGRHRPIWKDLEQVLLAHGVVTYSIFLDLATIDLFFCGQAREDSRVNCVRPVKVL